MTQVLHESIKEVIDALKEGLVSSVDEAQNAQTRGAIIAFRQVMAWEPEVEDEATNGKV